LWDDVQREGLEAFLAFLASQTSRIAPPWRKECRTNGPCFMAYKTCGKLGDEDWGHCKIHTE
jgi:hypothetical protein